MILQKYNKKVFFKYFLLILLFLRNIYMKTI